MQGLWTASLNLLRAFVHISFWKLLILIQICIIVLFWLVIDLLLLMHHAFYHNQVILCWYEKLGVEKHQISVSVVTFFFHILFILETCDTNEAVIFSELILTYIWYNKWQTRSCLVKIDPFYVNIHIYSFELYF